MLVILKAQHMYIQLMTTHSDHNSFIGTMSVTVFDLKSRSKNTITQILGLDKDVCVRYTFIKYTPVGQESYHHVIDILYHWYVCNKVQIRKTTNVFSLFSMIIFMLCSLPFSAHSVILISFFCCFCFWVVITLLMLSLPTRPRSLLQGH